MKSITLATATLLALATPFAFADHHEDAMAGHGAKFMESFKAADKDNDGTLDKEEAKALPRVSKNFDAIDTDKDGTVSPEEIKAAMKKKHQGKHGKMGEKFKAADKDNDGTLDKEEAKALPNVAKNFDAIDTDKDGTVSPEEIHTFMKDKRTKKD
ncbi:MAG: EF-hand domain-containing protein [Burkholderiales bacterium]|nr:EF-hand domain-containing protein [Burkholderiales bacterium]